MSHPHRTTTRRDFLKQTGTLAAASALAATFVPHVHAAEDNTIQVALIGCGGRGTGAAANALAVKRQPIKLVAMADVFADKLKGSFGGLSRGNSPTAWTCRKIAGSSASMVTERPWIA